MLQPVKKILEELTKSSKAGFPMESLIADFFSFFQRYYHIFNFEI